LTKEKEISAKKIARWISDLMQEKLLTISDMTRGMVFLDNLEGDYFWKKGKVEKKEVKKKEKVPVVLEESCIA
jgi:hypothetical protein